MSDATVRFGCCEVSEEMAELLAGLAEHDQDRLRLRQQLATVRTLLKTADADLAAERGRFPVCRCCDRPVPTGEVLAAICAVDPSLRLVDRLSPVVLAVWARGFCSLPCEREFAEAAPPEPLAEVRSERDDPNRQLDDASKPVACCACGGSGERWESGAAKRCRHCKGSGEEPSAYEARKEAERSEP